MTYARGGDVDDGSQAAQISQQSMDKSTNEFVVGSELWRDGKP